MDDVYRLRRGLVGLYARLCYSPILLLSGALVFTVLIGTALCLFDEAFLSQSTYRQYLPRDGNDDYAFLSLRAKQTRPTPTSPRLILIGTAAMRTALLSPPQIAAQLSQQYQSSFEVIDLMAAGQSALEAAAVLAEIQTQEPAIVILGISPSRLAASRDELQVLIQQPRLGFSNTALVAEAQALGLTLAPSRGPYLWQQRQFYSIRAIPFVQHLLRRDVPEQVLHPYLGIEPQSDQA